MVLVSLLKIPSFVRNFVKKTILATYDCMTGNITLVRNEKCTVDECPEQNTYQKVLQNSKLPNVLTSSDDGVDYTLTDKNKQDDGINIVELEESEYKEHCGDHEHLPSFLSFFTGTETDGGDDNHAFYHVFSINEKKRRPRRR